MVPGAYVTSRMNILFCIIRDIDPARATSGSAVRPLLIRRAFEDVADRVLTIDGNSTNRHRMWKSIDYSQFDAVYCELNTLPIAISDADHVPRHPFIDLISLRRIHQEGIPVAAYYRDIYWRYPGTVSSRLNPGTYLLMILHYLELRKLPNCLNHLFVPSMTMFDSIPTRIPRAQASALPPGAKIRDGEFEEGSHLRLLYIGGVLPPFYDLRPMIDTVATVSEIQLTICCRKQDWKQAKNLYNVPDNVTVVHRSGDELDLLYRTSDVFIMYRHLDSSNYLQFAMPVKLFEAIGAGLPVVTNKHTEMGEFVDQHDLGWTFTNEHELETFLRSISQDMQSVRTKRAVVRQERWNHTWQARAREILSVLDSYSR
jgi:glycosyltransferase involved in cell wall biosynthesis